MKRMEPFVVGRRTRKSTTVVVLRHPEKPAMPAIPGPWTVRAVVKARD